jgi:RND family efflux transporter MFP subunit
MSIRIPGFRGACPASNVIGCMARWRLWLGACVLMLPMAGAWASEFVGLVRPTADIQVSVPVAGVVERVLVRPGQWVREGQPLLEIDSTPQRIELRRRAAILQDEAEMVAARARRDIVAEMQRMTDAVASTTSSLSFEEVLKQRLETLSAQSRVAQIEGQKRRELIEQEQAQADVAQRVLRSPASGMVVDAPAQAGEWVKPGDPVLRIVDATTVELRFSLPVEAISALRVGGKLNAQFESGRGLTAAEGQVQFVSPVADPASGLSEVRAVFANPRGALRPGLKGVVRLPGVSQRPL